MYQTSIEGRTHFNKTKKTEKWNLDFEELMDTQRTLTAVR